MKTLVLSTSFQSKIGLLPKLKTHYLEIDKEVLQKFWSEKDKGSVYNQRFIITLSNNVSWHGGSMALGNNKAYIAISKARMKAVNADIDDVIAIELEKDKSTYGFIVPEEFEEVLLQDIDANHLFAQLPLGTQRAIIYIVLQLKSSDKRIEKSIFLLENLKKSPSEKPTMRHILGKDLD